MNRSVGLLLIDGILNYVSSMQNKSKSEILFYKQSIDLILEKSNKIVELEFAKGNLTETCKYSF